jgi:nucleoside-diphosphate-sugar epimerase
VLNQLLESKDWNEVVSLGRRKTGVSNPKLKEIVVADMLDKKSVTSVKLAGAPYDAMFVCHGTTRGKAGGANMFKKIEIDLTANVAELAAQNKIKHISVVSAQGANPDASAVDWIHPMLYVQTLGRKEKAVLDRAKAFEKISIFRPGMLNRLKGDRFIENVINYFGIGLSVDILAKAMIRDAETSSSKTGLQKYEGNTKIKALSNL